MTSVLTGKSSRRIFRIDMEDVYLTVVAPSEGFYTEKRSRFLSFAVPVKSTDDVHEAIDACRKRFHDARHVCWAYMLGSDRSVFRANDDGEPGSTAGKPILGQINSKNLTDVLVMVVRYFGGIELGTGGLIAAYRAAAADALANAEIEERTVDDVFTVIFEYPFQNEVMRIIKEEEPTILERLFEMECRFTLRIRKSKSTRLKQRLAKVERLRLEE